MKPRGVTLVELLAAISILVVVTALAMPAVRNRLGAARLDAAQGQIQAAILTHRAEAMRLGRPVVLEARTSSGEVELTVNTLDAASPVVDGSGPVGTDSKKPGAGAPTPQVWATLGSGLKITEQPEVAAAQKQPTRTSSSASGDATNATVSIRIAVFCPDGTAIAPGPTYLTDGETTLVVTVNQWIGGAVFTPYSAETADSGQKPEERPTTAPPASEQKGSR